MGQTKGEVLAGKLKDLGVKGVLIRMAVNGQLLALRCEMPTCYCPDGRRHFERWPKPPSSGDRRWAPNEDHYPELKRDGGQSKPWNIRLAHVACNNIDYGWRTRIRAMLEDDPTMSFGAIAQALNRKKNVPPPPPSKSWTARVVRRAYVS